MAAQLALDKKTPTTVRLDSRLRRELAVVAAREGERPSVVLRQLLREGLARRLGPVAAGQPAAVNS